MAFQLIPFFDEPAYDWGLMDFEPARRHQRCPVVHQQHPLAQLDRLSRHLSRLQEDMDMDGQVCLKDDTFRVDLNVDGFQPKDLNVSVKEDMLTITGKHEEKSEDGSRFTSRQFTRSYRLPETAQLDQMKSSLAADGRTLRISAPVLKPAIEQGERKEVPIQIHRDAAAVQKQG